MAGVGARVDRVAVGGEGQDRAVGELDRGGPALGAVLDADGEHGAGVPADEQFVAARGQGVGAVGGALGAGQLGGGGHVVQVRGVAEGARGDQALGGGDGAGPHAEVGDGVQALAGPVEPVQGAVVGADDERGVVLGPVDGAGGGTGHLDGQYVLQLAGEQVDAAVVAGHGEEVAGPGPGAALDGGVVVALARRAGAGSGVADGDQAVLADRGGQALDADGDHHAVRLVRADLGEEGAVEYGPQGGAAVLGDADQALAVGQPGDRVDVVGVPGQDVDQRGRTLRGDAPDADRLVGGGRREKGGVGGVPGRGVDEAAVAQRRGLGGAGRVGGAPDDHGSVVGRGREAGTVRAEGHVGDRGRMSGPRFRDGDGAHAVSVLCFGVRKGRFTRWVSSFLYAR